MQVILFNGKNTATKEAVAVFYFVYHISDNSGACSVGMSPCPEFDLAMAEQIRPSIMHVISPPLSVSAAHRAMSDASAGGARGPLASFYCVRKSLALYGIRGRMPSGPRRVPSHVEKISGIVMDTADILASKLEGRMLLMSEVQAMMPQSGPSLLAMAAQYMRARRGMELLPGIMYRGYGGRACARCGSTTGFTVGDCPECGSPSCILCSECSSMGSVRECEPVLAMPGRAVAGGVSAVCEPKMRYGLTKVQKDASDGVRSWLASGRSDEALVWAVCGAGKTEVSYGVIGLALGSGMRVLYAAPRRDVVAELSGRIAQAFPDHSLSSYYSGSLQRSGRSTDLTVATTHQAIRFYKSFDLTVLDEVDAFPYQGSRMLEHAVRSARSSGGRTLFMSATPSRALMSAAENGCLHTERISARHHGHPLPVPDAVRLGQASRGLISGTAKIPSAVEEALSASFEGAHPHFVFVPRKAAAEPLARQISQFFASAGKAGARVGWSHSQDADRESKRRAFSEGGLDVLVCTSIMERGVTVPGCDVSVIGADSPEIFDYRSLVQMAGRAGRQAARPTGSVRFFCAEVNSEMKDAISMIEGMNEDAATKGYLAKG